MAKDEDVLLCLGAANYDPTVFPEPEKLLLDQKATAKSISPLVMVCMFVSARIWLASSYRRT